MKKITNQKKEQVQELLTDMQLAIDLAEGVEENLPFSYDDYGKMLVVNSLIMQLGEQSDDLSWSVPSKVVSLIKELGI